MADQLDTIPPDATILVVRSVPREAGRRASYVDFQPGELFMWTDNYDPEDPDLDELECKPVAISRDAIDVFECEAWKIDPHINLVVFAEDVDPVDADLDAVIRAAVALIGEMPIDTDCLLSGLSNARAS